MDDRNDGFFDGSFFGGNFDKQFRDAMRDMDEMFKHLGDFHIDFRPPSVSLGGKVPGYNESPRDMMLKPDTNVRGESQVRQNSDTISPHQPRLFHPGFRPLSNRNNEDFSDSVSIFTSGPGSNNIHFQMSSHSTSIKHNPDGSIEKIVKKIENGQTCTTVTRTDKDGNTTTSTTCDRPGDIPNIRDRPLDQLRSPPQQPTLPSGNPSNLGDSDKSIFDRYFKTWFKPKDK